MWQNRGDMKRLSNWQASIDFFLHGQDLLFIIQEDKSLWSHTGHIIPTQLCNWYEYHVNSFRFAHNISTHLDSRICSKAPAAICTWSQNPSRGVQANHDGALAGLLDYTSSCTGTLPQNPLLHGCWTRAPLRIFSCSSQWSESKSPIRQAQRQAHWVSHPGI